MKTKIKKKRFVEEKSYDHTHVPPHKLNSQHRIEEISKKKTVTTKLRLLKSQRKSKADLEEDQS
jgi:hypothetical protein